MATTIEEPTAYGACDKVANVNVATVPFPVALATEGFVNYPTEYWHWSYGDRYWAYVKGEAQTIYDAVKVP